jgi:DNA-binding XRE family transcriptional regulator
MYIKRFNPKSEMTDNEYRISLRAARITSGYSIKKAAIALGISPQRLYKYERNADDLPVSLAKKIIQLYSVPLQIIYFGEASKLNKTIC